MAFEAKSACISFGSTLYKGFRHFHVNSYMLNSYSSLNLYPGALIWVSQFYFFFLLKIFLLFSELSKFHLVPDELQLMRDMIVQGLRPGRKFESWGYSRKSVVTQRSPRTHVFIHIIFHTYARWDYWGGQMLISGAEPQKNPEYQSWFYSLIWQKK